MLSYLVVGVAITPVTAYGTTDHHNRPQLASSCWPSSMASIGQPEPGQIGPRTHRSIEAQQKRNCWSPIFGQRVLPVLCASGFHLIGTWGLFGVGFGGWPVAASGRAGLSRNALALNSMQTFWRAFCFRPKTGDQSGQ